MSFEYGVLKNTTNTGNNDELLCAFTAPLSITNNAPESGSDTLSLKRKMSSFNSQRWEIETAFAPFATRRTFVHMAKHGTSLPFFIRMPQIYIDEDSSRAALSVSVLNSYLASATSIKLQTTTPSHMQLHDWVGMFINIAGHDKVYLVSDAIWNGSTNTLDVEVYPPLVAPVSNASVVKHSGSVSMRSLYTDEKASVRYTDGVLAEFSAVHIVEAL